MIVRNDVDDILTPAPVRKVIGKIAFDDPYAHLQFDTPDVLAWQWAESDYARDAVRALPHFASLVRECASEFQSPVASLPVRRGKHWFSARLAADGTGHELVRSESIDGNAEAFCLPTVLGGTVRTPAYVYRLTPSPDGAYVVVTVLPGGALDSKTVVVRVRDGVVFTLVLEALVFLGFAEPSWLPDSSGFVLGDRAPDRRHRVRRVTVHAETCSVDDYCFSVDEVSADLPVLTHHVSPGGRWSIGVSAPHERTATVIGDLQKGTWTRFLNHDFVGECHGDWLDDATYVAIATDRATRGEVVAIPIAYSMDRLSWRRIVPESDSVLRTLVVRSDRLVLADLQDVSFRLRVLGRDGNELWTVPLAERGASSLTFPPRITSTSDGFLFAHCTFTQTNTIYALDANNLDLAVRVPPRRTLSGLAVTQHFAKSKDGTQVPYYLIRRADLDVDTPRPAMLRAYGGFNLAFTPNYLSELVPFVRCGGIFIHANLRGGGEYGKDWHDQGRLHAKQTCFDDCYAVAEDVIGRGLTAPDKLVLQGASNGGLLAGVGAVQRPDLFCATIPQSPLLDMMEPVRPGAGEDAERVRAVFAEDYGDPDDSADAPVLFAYSPYHNITSGVGYAAVFQIFGENDLGCPPYHGRKFTARLRAATTSANPVLLRVWREGGHGGSSDPNEFGAMNAEMLAFAFQRTGLNYDPP